MWSKGADRNLLVAPILYANWHPHGSSFYSLFGYGKRENGWRSGSGFWIYWGASGPRGNEGYDVLWIAHWDVPEPSVPASAAKGARSFSQTRKPAVVPTPMRLPETASYARRSWANSFALGEALIQFSNSTG